MRAPGTTLIRTAISLLVATALLAGAAPAGAQVKLKRCPKVNPEARCGTVAVPLERGNPASRQIGIHFTVFRHTNRKREPLTPVYVIYGGPGFAPSYSTEGLFLLEPARRRHDLVVVDYRGEGRSDAVNCRPLQRLKTSNAALIQSTVGACGAQLGSTADDYGAADIADDIEAVRAALGHELINLYGQSYGTVHSQAYALRHGSHVRSLILDGAFNPLQWDTAVQAGGDVAGASARSVPLICGRSPSCAQDNSRPAEALEQLAARLRAHPFRGIGRDELGARKRVTIDERMLARIISGDDYAYIGQSELPAAAAALRKGDRKPLLRLAAFTGPDFDYEDGYRRDSAGMSVAAGCADFPVPWDLNAPVDQRRAQAAAAWATLPESTFSPISVQGWVDFWGPEFCAEWPAPTDPRPVFTPGVTFPDVPALVVSAELDLVTPESNGLLHRRSVAEQPLRGAAKRRSHARLLQPVHPTPVRPLSQDARDGQHELRRARRRRSPGDRALPAARTRSPPGELSPRRSVAHDRPTRGRRRLAGPAGRDAPERLRSDPDGQGRGVARRPLRGGLQRGAGRREVPPAGPALQPRRPDQRKGEALLRRGQLRHREGQGRWSSRGRWPPEPARRLVQPRGPQHPHRRASRRQASGGERPGYLTAARSQISRAWSTSRFICSTKASTDSKARSPRIRSRKEIRSV